MKITVANLYFRVTSHWAKRQSIYNPLVRTVLAICLGLLISRISAELLESYLYDLRITFRPPPPLSNQIEQVLIDLKTTNNLKTPPSADSYNRVFKNILRENPKAVLLIPDISQVKGSESDRLQLSLTLMDPRVLQASDDTNPPGKHELQPLAPFSKLNIVPAPLTRDKNILAKDSVTRRIILRYLDQWMIHSKLASEFNPDATNLEKVRGRFFLLQADQNYIDFHPVGSFPVTKFEDLANENPPSGKFANKIVIFGDDLHESSEQYRITPYDRSGNNNMSLTEVHANMIETLIQNSSPVRPPDWVNILITILISILTVHVALTVRPLKGILIILTTAAAYSVLAFFAFWPFGYWVGMAHPLIAIFLCYYFFIPYRLIIENRRSWEYYQKHKLLSEVEELKTNFIGMMSHDLKTPLARIQGMTEIIANDAMPLSAPQREALDTIQYSAEDLTKFISTILNYAKIESSGVELHWQSRDINELIKEAVKKNDFLAKIKHVQVITELEPLFAVKVDPDLIKQVFSNLIENAIKYSAENSKVLITTEEVDGKIVVQVADQGIGIDPADLPNIFMKFFRSKNAKSSPIKGSGLGLYLSKYFVELHHGTITAESSLGEGTTFTIELPVGQ